MNAMRFWPEILQKLISASSSSNDQSSISHGKKEKMGAWLHPTITTESFQECLEIHLAEENRIRAILQTSVDCLRPGRSTQVIVEGLPAQGGLSSQLSDSMASMTCSEHRLGHPVLK